ncbi:MAG: hypothetical protein ACE5EU_02120 [Paracoccaceae bacterium]
MRRTLLAVLAVALLAAGCGVGDPAVYSDGRHTSHFKGGSPGEDTIAGR